MSHTPHSTRQARAEKGGHSLDRCEQSAS
jgi:hypothetical protein